MMENAVHSIIERLEDVVKGQPWHGDGVVSILSNVDPSTVFSRVSPELHSPIEMILHLNHWTSFVLDRLSDHPSQTVEEVDANDWVIGDSNVHNWDEELERFYALYDQVLVALNAVMEETLEVMVQGKPYTRKYMLNGLVDHFIYHSAQLSYLNKFFASEDSSRVFQVL